MNIRLSSFSLGGLISGGSGNQVVKEISIGELNSQELVKLSKFCRVCNQLQGTDLKMSSEGLLDSVYEVGLNSDERIIQALFLSIHKDIKHRLEQLNKASKDTGKTYILPAMRG